MRALNYIFALAFALTGSSLAEPTDRDMPGVGTFPYSGASAATPASEMVAAVGQ